MGQHYLDFLKELSWIGKGDFLYVVSDMLELAKVTREQGAHFKADDLIDALQELVGEEGTIVFPTFNWDFCKGVAFDYYKTPSRTGALTKAALKRKDFRRTAHPIYSFAVWGKESDRLMENASVDCFGPGTIFEYMYEVDAKGISIGIPILEGLTYVHHVEQMVGVPYRYHKEFTAQYTDADGVCSERTYRMYVRDLVKDPQYRDFFRPLEEKMMEQGTIIRRDYEGVPFVYCKIRDVDAAAREDIIENDSRCLYYYHGQRKED